MAAFVHVLYKHSDPACNYVFGDFRTSEDCIERMRSGNVPFWVQLQRSEPELFADGPWGVHILTLESLGYVSDRARLVEAEKLWRKRRKDVVGEIERATAPTVPDESATAVSDHSSEASDGPTSSSASESPSGVRGALRRNEHPTNDRKNSDPPPVWDWTVRSVYSRRGPIAAVQRQRIRTVTEAELTDFVSAWLDANPNMEWHAMLEDQKQRTQKTWEPAAFQPALNDTDEPLAVVLAPGTFIDVFEWLCQRSKNAAWNLGRLRELVEQNHRKEGTAA